jgi:hypothetical protein
MSGSGGNVTGEPVADCGNCGAALSGEYCSACGQLRAERLLLHRALDDGWERLVELDFAFARTFAGLCKRPGKWCSTTSPAAGSRIQALSATRS